MEGKCGHYTEFMLLFTLEPRVLKYKETIKPGRHTKQVC